MRREAKPVVGDSSSAAAREVGVGLDGEAGGEGLADDETDEASEDEVDPLFAWWGRGGEEGARDLPFASRREERDLAAESACACCSFC